MRSPLASGWGVLVEVDEGAVLALCFLRSWIAVVSFYETATSSPANSLVHIHSWWSRGCPQRGVRKRERPTRRPCGAPVVHESTTPPRLPRSVLSRLGCCVDSYNPWVGTNHGCIPWLSAMRSWCWWCCPQCGQLCRPPHQPAPAKGRAVQKSKGTRRTNNGVCVAGAVCEVVGSAVTYSPTPSRGQYHRRGRA